MCIPADAPNKLPREATRLAMDDERDVFLTGIQPGPKVRIRLFLHSGCDQTSVCTSLCEWTDATRVRFGMP